MRSLIRLRSLRSQTERSRTIRTQPRHGPHDGRDGGEIDDEFFSDVDLETSLYDGGLAAHGYRRTLLGRIRKFDRTTDSFTLLQQQ